VVKISVQLSITPCIYFIVYFFLISIHVFSHICVLFIPLFFSLLSSLLFIVVIFLLQITCFVSFSQALKATMINRTHNFFVLVICPTSHNQQCPEARPSSCRSRPCPQRLFISGSLNRVDLCDLRV
jgi:hypothetical protein